MRWVTACASAAAIGLLASCASLPADVTVPDAATPPGTALAIGETARVPGVVAVDGQASVDGEVGITVLEVRAESASLLDGLENRGELDNRLDGVTPFVVVTQVDLAADTPDGARGPETGGVAGRLDSGESTAFVTTTNQSEVCDTPPADASLPSDVRCTILLVPEGARLVDVAWGLLPIKVGQAGPDDRSAEYADNPIAWAIE